MVQRILMLALVLLAFTMPTEAITLQELQTSPQFKLVHVQAMNPSPSTLALIEASESKSGLAMTEVDVAKYTFDGATKPMHYVNDTRKFPLNRNNTIMYDIADAMFMSVYQQHFDDIVVQ